MKAAVLTAPGTLELKEVPTPEPDADSALMRVRACAVCGSDVRIARHGNPRVTPPQILGHEAAGEVVAVGRNVSKIKVGDKISLGADIPCGNCSFCEDGMANNCQINYAMGYQFAGSFAQYVLLNRLMVDYGPIHAIPPGVTFEEAALAEPLACVLNALERTPVQFRDDVVVIGAGPIGCMIIPVAKAHGARRVIVIQRSPARAEMARRFGADVVITTGGADPVGAVLDLTDGLGAHLVITANPSPSTHADAIAMARNRGRVNLFGGLPANSRIELDTNLIHYKELTVSGAHGSLPPHHRRALEMIASGLVRVGDLITHRFSLDQTPEAFAAAQNRAGGRVVVEPWGRTDA
ncbi:MAG: alcohol dehydrogenase catalytic domain-containing protein [Bifidobacteriaceae bacterium]|jgi:L-iditol 2-dehydrogenase|nr:alcohol dehydrogenase catalytic domain-containing protein [Bifidobacteriaceae bacterium]